MRLLNRLFFCAPLAVRARLVMAIKFAHRPSQGHSQ